MSTDPGLSAVPAGPPWSVDVLSDLHAGVYSDDVSAVLRARVAGDPDAAAVLSALDATVDDLSLLPTPRMPERFALRLDAAIAAESAARSAAATPVSPAFRPDRPVGPVSPVSTVGPVGAAQPPVQRLTSAPTGPPRPVAAVPPAPVSPLPPSMPQQFAAAGGRPPAEAGTVVSLDAARTRRRRWIGGLAVAAAVVAAATITVSSLNSTGGDPSTAAGPASSAAPTLTAAPPAPNAIELTPGRFQDAYSEINGADSGPLTDGPTAAACYAANGIAGPDILGVSAVTYRGKKASAIAVKVDAGHARIVVVGLDCGVNGAQALLDEQTVTR